MKKEEIRILKRWALHTAYGLVSWFLITLLTPFAVVYTNVRFAARAIRKKNAFVYFKETRRYHHGWAFTNDQSGNVILQDVFNDWFTKPTRIKNYGNPDETISHVTGYNKGHNAFWGRFLAGLLNTWDAGHTERAAKNPQFNGNT